MINYELALTYLLIFNTILMVSIYQFNKKDFAENRTKLRNISQIKKYNQASGMIWLAYSVFFLIATLVELFQFSAIASHIAIIGGIGGGILLLIFKRWIGKKYKESSDSYSSKKNIEYDNLKKSYR